jgi:hypothetical protein
MAKTLKPGQTAPASGQYKVLGPRGGDQGVEVTVTKGEPMPPNVISSIEKYASALTETRGTLKVDCL